MGIYWKLRALCVVPGDRVRFRSAWDPYGNSYGNSLCARSGMVVAYVTAIAQKL